MHVGRYSPFLESVVSVAPARSMTASVLKTHARFHLTQECLCSVAGRIIRYEYLNIFADSIYLGCYELNAFLQLF
jgi:hypothetical protein